MPVLKLLTFFVAGILGILFHCFVEMNKLNKQQNGNFSLKAYIKLERFNIVTSVLGVVMCVMCGSFIKTLMKADYYLTPAFMAFGYLGESVLVAAFGKASDLIDNITGRKIEVEQIVQTKTTITEDVKPTSVTTKDDSGITS